MKLLEIYLVGIHRLSVWLDRYKNSSVVNMSMFFAAFILTIFLLAFFELYLIKTNQYGYFVVETNNWKLLYFTLLITLFLSFYLYVHKYKGVEEFERCKLTVKEKILCIFMYLIIIVATVKLTSYSRAYNIEYKTQTGWYERHPSKYKGKGSLESDIRNWFKEKFGDKENNK